MAAANSTMMLLSHLLGESVILRSTILFVVICVCLWGPLESLAQTPNAPVGSPSAAHGTIEHADITVTADSLTIEIALSAPFLPQGMPVTNPDRLVFDFPGFTLSAGNRQMAVNNGPVRRFRAAMFQSDPPIARVVVDLKEPRTFDVKSVGNKVLIEIPLAKTNSVPAASAPPATVVEKKSAPPAIAVEKKTEKKTEPETPAGRPETPPEPAIVAASRAPGANAYKLQDKAKELKVEDLQNLEDKSAAGDPEAQTLLALALHSGVLLKRDDAEALHLLRKAAGQGLMAAQESLGIFLAMGIGMERPAPGEALEWYRKAARQGSLDAATNIALMYADGLGVPKDPPQAIGWFRKAADGGDATAQYNLALSYGQGKGVPRDYKESLRWLTAAANQNVAPAVMDLADYYLHPPDGSPPDVHQAIHYYEKAAGLGSVPAEVTLGNFYASGAEGTADYEKAVTWYRKAADRGQPDAQFGLGLRYALGQGVPVDLEEALRLFIPAANQGQAGAQFNLGMMYEEGKGTPADRSLAVHYYQLSAEQGMPQAQFRLGRLLAGKRESRTDQVSAYKWLMLAANTVKESSPILSELRKSLTKEDVKEAERQVDSWRVAHAESSHR